MSILKQHTEALIFCSEQSITLKEIQASLEISMSWEVAEEDILKAIDELKQKYQSEEFAFELSEIAEGYQFLTKKEFYPSVSALLQHKAKKKLSLAQMETLAIIAYKQPISKSEIEHVRGVNCDYAVQKLLEKDLIEMKGKSEGPGKPMMYATSQTFMDYFGIKSVKDLPQLKDLHQQQNEIGMANDLTDAEPQFEQPALAPAAEIISETETPQVIEMNESEETIIVDEKPDQSELPDRKAIFLKHSQENESYQSSEEDSSSDEGERKFSD